MEETKQETIKIGDITYKTDSITEDGVRLIQDIQKIESEIQRAKLQVSIAELAKGTVFDALVKESANFEAIEVEEKPVDGEIVE